MRSPANYGTLCKLEVAGGVWHLSAGQLNQVLDGSLRFTQYAGKHAIYQGRGITVRGTLKTAQNSGQYVIGSRGSYANFMYNEPRGVSLTGGCLIVDMQYELAPGDYQEREIHPDDLVVITLGGVQLRTSLHKVKYALQDWWNCLHLVHQKVRLEFVGGRHDQSSIVGRMEAHGDPGRYFLYGHGVLYTLMSPDVAGTVWDNDARMHVVFTA